MHLIIIIIILGIRLKNNTMYAVGGKTTSLHQKCDIYLSTVVEIFISKNEFLNQFEWSK